MSVGWRSGAVLVAVGVGSIFRPCAAQCPDGSPPPCRAVSSQATALPTSVAVLGFRSLSPDTADFYLAQGLTEEIATSLGRVGRLRVAGSSAVRHAQERTPDDPQ